MNFRQIRLLSTDENLRRGSINSSITRNDSDTFSRCSHVRLPHHRIVENHISAIGSKCSEFVVYVSCGKASKMTSLQNGTNDDEDYIYTESHHIQSTNATTSTTIPIHRSMNQRIQNNIQNHSILSAKQRTCAFSHKESVVKRDRTLDKSSDFLRWHKTKSKACRWQMTRRIFLVITIVLFASLTEILICVAHAGDVTSLIRVSDDDDNSNNQKLSTSLARDGSSNGNAAAANSRNNPAIFTLDKFSSNLESNLAAVFNKVAYGTTTKRSISDTVFVPNLTTVPTPQLTTFR